MTASSSALILWFVTSVPAAVAQDPDPTQNRADFIPETRFPALPGRVVAVLAGDVAPIMKAHGRGGPQDALCLGAAGGGYRWTFFPVDADPSVGREFRVGPKGDRKKYPRVRMGDVDTLKPWGIRENFTLVEAEINEGVGSPAGQDAVVIGKVRILDGTREYPLRTATVVADLRKKYQDFVDAGDAEVAAVLEQHRKATLEAFPFKPATPRPGSTETLMYVTWMPETEKLQVRFRTKKIDGLVPRHEGRSYREAPPPVFPGVEWGLDFGMCYEVARNGSLEKSIKLPIKTYTRSLD